MDDEDKKICQIRGLKHTDVVNNKYHRYNKHFKKFALFLSSETNTTRKRITLVAEQYLKFPSKYSSVVVFSKTYSVSLENFVVQKGFNTTAYSGF